MSSSVDSHSVPPFYACYLLRSYATSSSARTYIGSTPDPARRKKQHNGILTQGAHKTKRGRPWETQMLVYGFPSKIAALQFEWAWQKPHMSRHLRTHPPIEHFNQPSSSSLSSSSSSLQQQDHVALPLFTDTPLNQIAIGKDGCKPLPCSSVQTSLLVARALLKSEPFAGWGLQIIFFEEYLWAAWNRLQTSYLSIANHTDAVKVGLYLNADQTRLRRPLPPHDVSPNPICDFAGVDGGRKSMLRFSEEERKAAKLEDATISKSKSISKGKAIMEGKSPGLWPEKLPRTLNVRSMGGTWQMLENAPYPAISGAERGKKKEVQQDCISKESEHGSKFHLDDEDVAFQSFKRFQRILDLRNLSIEDVLPLSVTTADKRSKEAGGICNICRNQIDLRDHTSYTLCSSPFEELQPRPTSSTKNKTKNLSLFGFGIIPSDGPQNNKQPEYRHCDSLFHTRCLAQSFLKQNNQKGTFLLPTHGYCPICHPSMKPSEAGRHSINTWNEVIRCTFRRRDYVLREAKVIEAGRMKAAKVAIQQAKKVRKTNTIKRSGNAIKKKKNPSSRLTKEPIRHGDSDQEEEQEMESEKENETNDPSLHSKIVSVPTNKAGSSGRGGLMDMLHQIEEEGEGEHEAISNIAALATKRTVPSNWTPLPSRTAPLDRTNMQRLDPDTLLDDEIESVSPTKAGNYANPTKVSKKHLNIRTFPTNLDVIDLT